jgi:YbaB/EbfC DNA-binding family protein
MFDESNPGEATRRIDDWQSAFDRQAAQARELAARTANLTATAQSPDGAVAVTLGPSGALKDLHLTESTRRQPAAETARQILATLAAAHTHLTELTRNAAEETVGADSEIGRAVIAALNPR